MKTSSSLFAAATLLLHAALVAAVLIGLSAKQAEKKHPAPLVITLLPPAPVQQPALAPEPPRPAPSRPTHEPQKPVKEVKKPAEKPRTTQTPPTRPVDPASEAEPAAPAVVASRAAATAPSVPAAPSTPLPPPKMSASVASYAASNRKPPYPRLSRRNDEQGTVVLRVLVKADGSAGAVEVKTSSGYPLLDESARSTVQTWRFNPATVDGKPVTEWYQVAIPFTLQEN